MNKWLSTLFLVASAATATAEPDGVTGLPPDVTSLLSLAGIWQAVPQQYITSNNAGIIANTFHGVFAGTSGDNLVLTGWAYNGFDTGATSTTPVNIALLVQQADGTMKLATELLLASPLTNGSGSVVVADFNGDGKADIFLAAHNESPLIARPSTVLLSNSSDTFDKVTLNDAVMAHDAELAMISNTPIVFTRTFTPGDSSPVYWWANGSFQELQPANLSVAAGGDAIAVAEFGGPGKYGVVMGDIQGSPGFPWQGPGSPRVTAVYALENGDIANTPSQIIPGYFNTRPQYANVVSYFGPGQTDVYRLWVDDFNHDGLPDVIAAADLWNPDAETYPAALQLLQNQGGMTFKDVSDRLGANLPIAQRLFDYTTQIRDIDHSGINTYLSAQKGPNHTNYIFVNDGTGQFHVAMHDIFSVWGSQIWDYLHTKLDSSYGYDDGTTPKFLGYLTSNGKLNFLALVRVSATVNGLRTQRWALVNVPVQVDISRQFMAPLIVTDRNGSHLIRTFAGDDVIYSGNSGGHAAIDGGLGTNTVIYAGPSANYTVINHADGSWTVRDNVGADGVDTLVRIQSLKFADNVLNIAANPSYGRDTYDTSNNRLTIPQVLVGNTVYTNAVITVGEVVGVAGGTASADYDTYDAVTNRLTIPSVVVNGFSYFNVTVTIEQVVSVGGRR